MASDPRDNESVNQPSTDPEMPIPTPPDDRGKATDDAATTPELVDQQIEDRFEATDN